MRHFFRNGIIFITVCFLLISSVFSQKAPPCAEPSLEKPDKYERGSENFYLSWIKFGKAGQKALASQKLLEIEDKKNYESTKKLWECEKKKIAKASLLFSLFDQKPANHLEEVLGIFEKGDKSGSENIQLERLDDWTPEPYSSDLAKGWNTLWFDIQCNAAFRLVGNGYNDRKTFEYLINIASFWPLHSLRVETKKKFDLFEGIPEYETAPEVNIHSNNWILPSDLQKDIEKFGKVRKSQLTAIMKWYLENESKLKWNGSQKKYILERSAAK